MSVGVCNGCSNVKLRFVMCTSFLYEKVDLLFVRLEGLILLTGLE